MMKLILSLALLWMLCSTVGALMCEDSKKNTNHSCAPNEYCAAAASQGSPGDQQSKSCVSSSICDPVNQMFSFNFGFYNLTASVKCCKTNSCNSDDVTYPAKQKENVLKCFTCDNCTETVQCGGDQDRCLSGSVATKNTAKKVFGCASKNLCDASSKLNFLSDYLNFTSGPKCCVSSLCNSASAVKLSVAPFLLGLIMLAAC
ncbi:urokinase plasminogen activator surface receptor-like [Epinephelus moara]|uniref:urokinase plasminogen activator surface receptor-like n=1 Tax=Epinephelus moara TaxID=300413 RepID=UPI00214E31D4|nr:urokinase plasminogen activator surface receptor-like [Epinephelus moara]